MGTIKKFTHLLTVIFTKLISHQCAQFPTAMKYHIWITVLWILPIYECATKNVIHKKTEQITNSLVEQNNEVINHNLVKTNLDDLQKIVKTAISCP